MGERLERAPKTLGIPPQIDGGYIRRTVKKELFVTPEQMNGIYRDLYVAIHATEGAEESKLAAHACTQLAKLMSTLRLLLYGYHSTGVACEMHRVHIYSPPNVSTRE